ncbi:hypothetical protein NL108_002523 [Boleophthalmus pectinirostris]|nr:hypothetical protein NL108_002523 [Boleophthalmus pectinirostris]
MASLWPNLFVKACYQQISEAGPGQYLMGWDGRPLSVSGATVRYQHCRCVLRQDTLPTLPSVWCVCVCVGGGQKGQWRRLTALLLSPWKLLNILPRQDKFICTIHTHKVIKSALQNNKYIKITIQTKTSIYNESINNQQEIEKKERH